MFLSVQYYEQNDRLYYLSVCRDQNSVHKKILFFKNGNYKNHTYFISSQERDVFILITNSLHFLTHLVTLRTMCVRTAVRAYAHSCS